VVSVRGKEASQAILNKRNNEIGPAQMNIGIVLRLGFAKHISDASMIIANIGTPMKKYHERGL